MFSDDVKIKREIEQKRLNIDFLQNQKYSEINQEVESVGHRSQMVQLEQKLLNKMSEERQKQMYEQAKIDEKIRQERIQRIQEMEK